MERREALKLLAGAAALPLLTRNAFSLFQTVHQQLPKSGVLKTLNAHQNATIIAIAEMIIPATETPGAKAARVNEFIDVILTDWYDDKEKQRFLAGLADVDRRSRELFGRSFVRCRAKQQASLLSVLDEQLAEARQGIVPGSGRRGKRRPPGENFFFMMKQLTLIGYYTSEIGAQETHWEAIPSARAACAPLPEEAAN